MKYFPIMGSDGKPSFRVGQKEAIQQILHNFESCKIVGLEGPVGCGKSVINYTVGRNVGRVSTYITSRKDLQDQITREGWDGVKSLKGRGAYVCNYNNGGVSCTHDDESHLTCNNCSLSQVIKKHDLDDLLKTIKTGDRLSSFKSKTDLVESFNKMYRKFIDDWREISNDNDPDNPGLVFKNLKHIDFYDSDKIHEIASDAILQSICCKLRTIECYHRSSRSLMNVTPVRVVNPDVMYYYNLSPSSPLMRSDALIIDECHGFDAVIQRIFNDSIPLGILSTIYGVSPTKDDIGEYQECMARLSDDIVFLKRHHDFFTVRNFDTYQNFLSSRGNNCELTKLFTDSFGGFYSSRRVEVDLIKIFCNPPDGLCDNVDKFLEGAGHPTFLSSYTSQVVESIYKYLGARSVDMASSSTVSRFKKWGIDKHVDPNHEQNRISTGYVIITYLIKIQKIISEFFSKYEKLASIGGVFAISNGTKLVSEVYKNSAFADEETFVRDAGGHDGKFVSTLDIVVVKPGDIANVCFYSTAKKILLSSGTWIYQKTVEESLGVHGIKMVKIPSTFPKRRRPIIVLEGLYDFSQKEVVKNGKSPKYLYDVEPSVFVDILENTVLKIKAMFKKSFKITPNILIHCHKKTIAEYIAENLHNPLCWRIHLDRGVRNVHNKKNMLPTTKDSILKELDENHDSGIVAVSFSLTEGVDFKDGKARAQIILKHPMPNIGDTYISKRMYGDAELGIPRNSNFFDHCVYTTLVQQYGRVMRSETDWGLTFTFDDKTADSIRQKITHNMISDMNAPFFFEGINYTIRNNKVIFSNLL